MDPKHRAIPQDLPLRASSAAPADPPPGCYDSVDATDSTALRSTLHAVIDDHVRVLYNSTGDDAWTVIELADEDPNDAGHTMPLTVGGRVPGSASCV